MMTTMVPMSCFDFSCHTKFQNGLELPSGHLEKTWFCCVDVSLVSPSAHLCHASSGPLSCSQHHLLDPQMPLLEAGVTWVSHTEHSRNMYTPTMARSISKKCTEPKCGTGLNLQVICMPAHCPASLIHQLFCKAITNAKQWRDVRNSSILHWSCEVILHASKVLWSISFKGISVSDCQLMMWISLDNYRKPLLNFMLIE